MRDDRAERLEAIHAALKEFNDPPTDPRNLSAVFFGLKIHAKVMVKATEYLGTLIQEESHHIQNTIINELRQQ